MAKKSKQKPKSRMDQVLIQTWIPRGDGALLRELALETRDMSVSAYLRRLIDKHLKEIRDARA